MRWALALLLAAIPHVARAQDAAPDPVRAAALALDDRALAAELYAEQTFRGYAGPSRAESIRALAHVAALLDAMEALEGALRAAGAEDLAAEAASMREDLRTETCPDLTGDEWSRLATGAGRAQLAGQCETTSTLIDAVRGTGASGLVNRLAGHYANDCALARRVTAQRVRGLRATLNADLMAALSNRGQSAEERREIIAELRAAGRAPRDAPAPADYYRHLFAPGPLERYRAAHAAWRAASPGEERARERELGRAAVALASSPDPADAEIATLRRVIAALEETTRAVARGQPVTSHLERARGHANVDPELAPLEEAIRAHVARCPRP